MSGKLGVLILDTRFPRLPGDPGNQPPMKFQRFSDVLKKPLWPVWKGGERFNTNDRLGLTY